MTATSVIDITYAGSLLAGQITTSPWSCVYAHYPDRGGIAYSPQFELDVLQPKNVDGARYRVSGAHFPVFKLMTITPATTYLGAQSLARQMELAKGDFVRITDNGGNFEDVMVIEVRAVANAKRVIGATASGLGGSVPLGVAATANASVDAEWTLQVIPV